MKWRVRHQKKVVKASTAVSSKAVETLTSFEAIKMFATERLETIQYSELRRELQNASIETKWLLCMFQFGQSIVMGTGLLVGMTLTVQDGKCTLYARMKQESLLGKSPMLTAPALCFLCLPQLGKRTFRFLSCGWQAHRRRLHTDFQLHAVSLWTADVDG